LKLARSELLKHTANTLLACSALLLALGFPCAAAAEQDLDKSQAESRLKQVTQAIGKLREQLEESRSDHRKEQDQLRAVDLAIQQANLDYRALEQQRKEHLAELETLRQQRENYLSSLDERIAQLSEQVRSAYRMSSQSRIKLVLNQDDPVRLGRMLAYYDYLNRAQVDKISGLREALTTLEGMQQSIDRELLRVENVQNEQRAVLNRLKQQREERNILLAQLSSQIDSEETRLQELEQNRRDLETLLERLSDVLADIPADLGSRVGIAKRKGRLPLPVTGPVRHAFGQRRAGGLHWRGWLIGAETGTEVKSVAYGRVAFADWLRGYGLLMIIDHGQGYLSLYAHNESLLREAGAWVEPGEIISIVGSNPGSDQGLYFELRKNGKAVDPAAWLKR
jgi:septal ring factor EnvC (AmiA/AmiB activator)